MEQDDSLRNELQNLSRLQSEQIEILKSMNDAQRQDMATRAMQTTGNANAFNNPAIYQSAAAPFQAQNANFQPQLISPYAQNMQQNFAQHVQNLQGGGGRYGFLNVVSPGTQYGLMSRDLMSMDYGSRIGKATVAGVGAAASTAASFGLSAALPGMAGLGVGMGAGAIAGLYVDAATDQIDRNNALKKYIYKNSGRFISSFESNNDRGISGFSREESADAANFVRKLNTEFYMSDDEMSSLLQSYTEGGLLKDAKDLDSFKEKMRTLTKSVKEGALILNETYDSIADLMAEMKKAGLDVKDFNGTAGLANILSGLTGGDASEILRNLVNYTINLNGGTGNDSDDTLSRVEDTAVYMSEYLTQLEQNKNRGDIEESNYNMIKNLGGPIEASKYINTQIEGMMDSQNFLTAGMAFFDYDATSKSFNFNKESFNKFTNGNMSYREMYENAENKFQELVDSGNGAAVNLWNTQGSMYLKNNLGDGQMTSLVSKVLSALTNDPELAANGFDYRTALSQMGISDASVQNLITGFIGFKGDNPDLARQVNLQNLWQQQLAGQLANAPSISERVGAGWEKFKEGATGWAVSVDNWAGERIQDISNWWNGTDKLPVRYDSTFNMKSDLKRISYDDVVSGLSQTSDMISATRNSLVDLVDNGYSVDNNLYNYVNSKYWSGDNTVQYGRSIISDWSKVGDDLKENKDLIQNIALQNKISEIIVASLVKYKQVNPDNNLDITKTSEELGQQLFNYGGNQQLAMAAAITGQSNVDKILNSQGIDIETLRYTGTQEQLKNYNLQDLKLTDDQMKKIQEMFNQNVFNNGGGGGSGNIKDVYGNDLTTDDLVKRDLRTKSGLTANDMELLIKDVKEKNPNSMLEEGMGAKFIEAEEKTGVDALYWFSHAMHETGYGTSGILEAKNNWYGWGAVDSAPMAGAWSFDDRANAIVETAEKIAANYQNSSKNQQNTLYDMRWSNPGHQYATDAEWDDKIANIWMKSIEFFEEKGIGLNYEASTPEELYTKEERVFKTVKGEDFDAAMKKTLDWNYDTLKATSDYSKTNSVTSSLKSLQKSYTQAEDNVINGKAKEITEEMEKEYQDLKLKLYNSIAEQLDVQKLDTLDGKTPEDILNFSEEVAEAYKEKMKGMLDFINDESTGDALRWSIKMPSEKLAELELFKEIGKTVDIGIDLDSVDLNSFFSEEDLEMMKGIVGGKYNGLLQGDTDAYDYKEWLSKGSVRLSVEDAAKDYFSTAEGFGEVSDQNSLSKAQEFMKQTQVFNNSAGITIDDLFLRKDSVDVYEEAVAMGMSLTAGSDMSGKKIFGYNVNKYKEHILDALNSGKYDSLEDILTQNEDVLEASKIIKKGFKDSGQADAYLESINNLFDIKTSTNKNGSYNVLETFGSTFFGINEGDFNGRADLYNKQLVQSANEFYQYYSQGFSDYLYGVRSEQADRIKNMNASEKATFYDVMKQMQYALDIKDGDDTDAYETVDEIFGGRKSRMYTEEEIQKMRHINDNGVYDATFYNETEDEDLLIDRFENYVKGGEKKNRSSNIRADLMASGIGQGTDAGDTLEEIRNAIKEQIEIAKDQSREAVLNAQKMGEAVASKIQDVGFDATDEELALLKNFLEYGDTEGLTEIKKKKQESDESFDAEAFDKLIEVAKNVKALDVSGLNKLLTTMQDISNIITDTGSTASLLYNDNESMGGYKEAFEQAMKEGIESVFGGDSNLLGEEVNKLLTDLANGKGQVDGVDISANTLEQLATITADAVDAGLRETLAADGGIDVVTNSSIYKSVGNDYLDAMASEIKDLSDKIKKAGETSTEGQNLAEQQEDLIDAFVQSYQESLKELGTTAKDSKTGIEEVAKNTQDTIDTFKTTMSQYDSAIESAITTMQDTIKTLKKDNSGSKWKFWASNDTDDSAVING